MFRFNLSGFRQRYLTVTLFLFVILGKYVWMLLNGQTYIPTWVYHHLTPWVSETKSPWNVLSADGLFEFLPWRTAVMDATASGHIPIVNPYSASTMGGQPLLANGQSGFFYPLHWIFWLLPASLAPTTLMLSIVIHMAILAVGTFLLARRLSAGNVGAVIAAIGFSQSATIVTWLPLASHLTVVAWLPWMWLATLNRSYKLLAIFSAMSLLAGHLQLSMYSLLTSAIFALVASWKNKENLRLILALCLGIVLAMCQMVPSIELGQQSHRGGVAASPEGYAAYIGNALPVHQFITWFIPNYFGHPNLHGGSSWIITTRGVPNNYAEWALYAGVLIPTLCFAGMFSYRSFRREHKIILFVAVLALLVAVGSPICAVMYYGIPGFAATGNPARVLPVLCLAMSLLAGVSVSNIRLRYLSLGIVSGGIIAGCCVMLANQTISRLSLPVDITSALAADGLLSQVPIIVLTLIVVAVATRLRNRFPIVLWILPLVLLADISLWTATYHPIGKMTDAVQTTPGIEFLKKNAASSPIASIVETWSMGSASPQNATLPPNILSLHRLHDIATYDSLILRKDKSDLESLAGVSLMPPENGNLLRIPSLEVASRLGAKWIILPRAVDLPVGWDLAYAGDDMTIIKRQGQQNSVTSTRNLATTAIRFGMFISLLTSSIAFLVLKPRRRNR